MADTRAHHEDRQTPPVSSTDAVHDAWFREQVKIGLKEVETAPENCTLLEDVLKKLDL